MNILGLDPGFQRLGAAALHDDTNSISLSTFGLIENVKQGERSYNTYINEGINLISIEFPKLIDITRPNLIIAELVPPGKLSARSELVVAAITTCKVIAFQFGIEWKDIAANSVKKQLVGDGNATKVKIRDAVFNLFPEVEKDHIKTKKQQKSQGEIATGLPQDIFDAIAIAYVGMKLYGNTTNEDLPEVREREAADTV